MLRYITEFKAGYYVRLLCVSVFFIMQSLTIVHATEHGDHHHEHEGVACSISLIVPEVDAVLPPTLIISVPQAFKAPIAFQPIKVASHSYHECRGPPGRAPPAFFFF